VFVYEITNKMFVFLLPVSAFGHDGLFKDAAGKCGLIEPDYRRGDCEATFHAVVLYVDSHFFVWGGNHDGTIT